MGLQTFLGGTTMRLPLLTWLLLTLGYALACGGRYERNIDDSVSDVGGSSATGASAGGPSQVEECAKERQAYADFRRETIAIQSMNGCVADADCGLFEDRTGCSPSCSFVIPNSARRGIDDRLYTFAEASCNPACPTQPIPPCPVPAKPVCNAGRCR